MRALLWFLIGFAVVVVPSFAYALTGPEIFVSGDWLVTKTPSSTTRVNIGATGVVADGLGGVNGTGSSTIGVGGRGVGVSATKNIPRSSVAAAGRLGARLLGPLAVAGLAYEAYNLFWDEELGWVVPENNRGGGSSFSGWSWRHHASTGSCRTAASTCSYEEAAQEACAVTPGSNGSVWHGNYTSSSFTCRRTDTTTWTTAASKTTVYVPPYVPATDAHIQTAIDGALGANPHAAPYVLQKGQEAGYDVAPGGVVAAGPATVPGRTSTSTTTGPAGQTTTTTTETHNLTYNTNVITIVTNITTTTTAPDGSQTTTTETETAPEGGEPIEEKPSLCEEYPNASACQELGQPEEEDMPEQEQEVSWDQEGGASGSCPAPQTVTVGGQVIEGPSWQPLCDFASGIRPFVIGIAWLSAGIFLLAVGRATR